MIGLALALALAAGEAVPAALPATGAPRAVLAPGGVAGGEAYSGYRGADGQATGATLAVAPPAGPLPVFLRAGIEATPWSSHGALRLSWAAGLESPRDGTCFALLSGEGRTAPGAFDRAAVEAAAGCKAPRACAGPFCLASRALATWPLDGGPWAGAGATLVIAGTWFLDGGFGRALPGALARTGAPDWRLWYSVGRWDGRPGGLFVTYADRFTTPRLRALSPKDRQGQGALVAGVHWSY